MQKYSCNYGNIELNPIFDSLVLLPTRCLVRTLYFLLFPHFYVTTTGYRFYELMNSSFNWIWTYNITLFNLHKVGFKVRSWLCKLELGLMRCLDLSLGPNLTQKLLLRPRPLLSLLFWVSKWCLVCKKQS